MAIFGKKPEKKVKKVGDVLDIGGQETPENIVETFAPEKTQATVKQQQKAKTEDGLYLSSDNENYKAFETLRGTGSTAINIDIRMKDENYFLMNCHLIKGTQFKNNTSFEMLYDQDRFIFTGKNLLQIKPFLLMQKVMHLQEFDTAKHISPVPDNQPVITSIKWIRIDDQINDALY